MLDMTVMLPATGYQPKQSRQQGRQQQGRQQQGRQQQGRQQQGRRRRANAEGKGGRDVTRPEAASNDSLEKEQAVDRT